jgi:hypothetical protein
MAHAELRVRKASQASDDDSMLLLCDSAGVMVIDACIYRMFTPRNQLGQSWNSPDPIAVTIYRCNGLVLHLSVQVDGLIKVQISQGLASRSGV